MAVAAVRKVFDFFRLVIVLLIGIDMTYRSPHISEVLINVGQVSKT